MNDTCPSCGGPADNGYDRSYPPEPYACTKCEAEEREDAKRREESDEMKRLRAELDEANRALAIVCPLLNQIINEMYQDAASKRDPANYPPLTRRDFELRDAVMQGMMAGLEMAAYFERMHEGVANES